MTFHEPVLRDLALVRKQPPFDSEAVQVTAERPVGPYHPVARDERGDQVPGARLGRRAYRRWSSCPRGQFGVGDRGAGRDLAQRRPAGFQERPAPLLDGYGIDGGQISVTIGI